MVNIWRQTLRVLEQRLPAKDYANWIAPIRPATVADGTATLEVPNGFFRDWVRQYFIQQLSDALADASGQACRVSLVVNRELGTPKPRDGACEDAQRGAPRQACPSDQARQCRVTGYLVPEYTLETFVVGAANELAAGGAAGVAAEPGRHYNPLFIHGGVGLGKTHLLNAVGHGALARHPAARVGCLTAEVFVNEMIAALRRDQMDKFRTRFRRIDVLIIDDVQFLGGKVRSQEEFFHTFNTLHDGRRQIVLASDKPPHEIRDLEECLRSRFASGLLAPIALPDAALRAAIVTRKAATQGLALGPELSAFIAKSLQGNVRALEGVLNAIRARATIAGQPLTRELVRDVLRASGARPDAGEIVSAAITAAAAEFAVPAAEITSPGRSARVVLARQAATFLCRELTDLPLAAIGQRIGRRDHSTVLYGLARVAERRTADPVFRERLDRLLDSLRDQ
jgi:chromosomal replication initiator protein